MGQASSKMRRTERGFMWWCPACDSAHPLPDTWKFNGDLERPTFRPSFKHTGTQIARGPDGEWNGNWLMKDEHGNVVEAKCSTEKLRTIPWCCHYVITSGIVHYQGDCTHDLKGKVRLMPPLPEHLCDP
jgi:hypothetical protein